MSAYIVNMDYEHKLYSAPASRLESSRINQEFEYVFFLIHPEKTLYTTRAYAPEYLQFIAGLSGREPQFTSVRPAQLIPWWGSFEDLERKQKLNSKAEVWLALRELGLLPEGSQLLHERPLHAGSGFLYKDCYGFSGKGLVTGDDRKLQRLGLPLIMEPLLERVEDFSYLNTPEQGVVIHNLVDQRFQYKGTLFTPQLPAPRPLLEQFTGEIIPKLISQMKLSTEENWSVDTFSYRKSDGGIALYPGSEVNYRKTMGLVALELRRRLAANYPYCEFRIRKQSAELRRLCMNPKRDATGGVLALAPSDSVFQCTLVYAMDAESLQRLNLEHLGAEVL